MATRLRKLVIDRVDLVDKGANPDANILFFKQDVIKAPTKREDNEDFPKEAFAYTPEPDKPSTWKLRLWDSLADKETAAQVGRAVAALGPGGFRGNRVEIPEADLAGVKDKVLAAWRRTHPDADDVPNVLKGGDAVEGTLIKWFRLIGKRLGLTDEEVKAIEQESAQGAASDLGKMYGESPMTTGEIMEHQKAMEDFYELRSAFMRSMDSILGSDEQEEHADMLMRSVEEFAVKAKPMMERMKMKSDMEKANKFADAVAQFKSDDVLKAGAKISGDRMVRLKQMRAMLDQMIREAGGEDNMTMKGADNMADDVTKRLEELEKAASRLSDVEKRLTDAEAKASTFEKRAQEAEVKLAKAEQDLAGEREIRVSAEYAKRAAQYPHTGDTAKVAQMLRKAYEVGEDFGKQLEETLKAANEQIAKGALFASVGKAGSGDVGDDYTQIESEGAKIAKAQNVTVAKGIDLYLQTPEGRAAYARYEQAKGEAN